MKDNYDWVLETTSHPERFNSESIDALFRDPEFRELYHLLGKTADACAQTRIPDINAEWHKFASEYNDGANRRYRYRIFSSKAAAALIGIFISIAVVAATIGIRYTLHKPTHKDDPERLETVYHTDNRPVSSPEPETVLTDMEPIVFKNMSLDRILHDIADYYGYEVAIKNEKCLDLKLYFRWDQKLPIEEIVEQLNNFEQLHLALNGNILEVN